MGATPHNLATHVCQSATGHVLVVLLLRRRMLIHRDSTEAVAFL
jgi:hypothetical protein